MGPTARPQRRRSASGTTRRRPVAPIEGSVGERPEEPLAGGADQHRSAEGLERRELIEQLDVLFHGLGEAEAGVQHDPLGSPGMRWTKT